MRRRRLLELAAVAAGDGVALASASAGAVLEACNTRGSPAAERTPGWQPTLFSRAEALCAEDLAELLIPEGDTPGAKSANVAQFIESFVREVYEDAPQRAFLDGLRRLDTLAAEAHGKAFHACSRAEQEASFAAVSAEGATAIADPALAFARSFRELCIRGFCSSKLGATRVLQYEPTPGEFQGCVSLESVGKAWATW